MGRARWLHDNYITGASMITPSSTAPGIVTNAQKEGSGSGTLTPSGSPTVEEDAEFFLRIDSVAAGTELGQATFEWSDSGGSIINEGGVLTSDVGAALNSGVSVVYAGGTGADFAVDDRWTFLAIRPFGKAGLIDRDRDTEWRSDPADGTASAVNVVVDLGSAQTPRVVVVLDHNFSSTAEIQIQGSSDSAFASLDYEAPLPWHADVILFYLGQQPSLRYWRLRVIDPDNTDGYLRVSELYIGGYTETARSFELGDVRETVRLGDLEATPAGRWYGGLNATVTRLELEWAALSEADKDALVAVYDDLNDVAARRAFPCLLNMDSDDPADTLFAWWDGPATVRQDPDAPERYLMSVTLVEIPRTV